MSLLRNMVLRQKRALRKRTTISKGGKLIDDSKGITPFVVDQDRIKQKPRLKGVLEGGLVHATHLCKICPRQVALIRRTKSTVLSDSTMVNSNVRLIWATGRAFEDHIRGQLISLFDKSTVIGSYQCRCGSNKEDRHFNRKVETSAESLTNNVCNYCGTLINNYVELPIKLHEYHSVFSPDFGYINMKNKGVVVEMKSIKKEDFEKLNKPDIEHVRQAFTYNLAAKEDKADMADYVIILYASKGWINPKDGYPYKEYKVLISDYQHIYDAIPKTLETGKIIGSIDMNGNVESVYDSGDGYPKGVCKVDTCATARHCQVSAMCFMLKHRNLIY